MTLYSTVLYIHPRGCQHAHASIRVGIEISNLWGCQVITKLHFGQDEEKVSMFYVKAIFLYHKGSM